MMLTAWTRTIARPLVLLALLFVYFFCFDILFDTMGAQKLWHGRVHRSEANSAYEDLQSIYNSEDRGNKGATKPVITKTDAQFEACKHLFATSARFRDAANVMSGMCDAFLDVSAATCC